MKWGLFDRREQLDETLHVAPMDANERIAVGHTVHVLCACQPRREQIDRWVLITHREES